MHSEDGGRGCGERTAGGLQQLQKVRNTPGVDPWEEHTSADTVSLAQKIHFRRSNLQNYKIINESCFKPLNL